MASHERIDLAVKPLFTYICSPDHLSSAIECANFLSIFTELKPWKAQYPADKRHSVWYVSFTGEVEEPYILNLNIRPKHFQLEFRHPQFLPQNIATKLKVNQKWLCANSNRFSETALKEMLSSYSKNTKDSFDKNQIKFVKWHPRISHDC